MWTGRPALAKSSALAGPNGVGSGKVIFVAFTGFLGLSGTAPIDRAEESRFGLVVWNQGFEAGFLVAARTSGGGRPAVEALCGVGRPAHNAAIRHAGVAGRHAELACNIFVRSWTRWAVFPTRQLVRALRR